MTRRLKLSAAALLLLVAAIALPNYFLLHRPLSAVLSADPRNTSVTAFAHFKYGVSPNTVVFDLFGLSDESRPVDVFRVLLQFAAKQKDHDYVTVALALRGTPKFLITGAYFKQLGEEYATQNPVYTMRTFPENLKRPDGSRAFPAWEGGWLGVMGKQVEDFGEFHKQWYLHDLAAQQ